MVVLLDQEDIFSPVGLYFSTDLSCLSGLRREPPPHAYTPTRDSTGAVRGTSDKATRNRRVCPFFFRLHLNGFVFSGLFSQLLPP